ncbi:MAG: NAD(P)H-binding protein [Bacteroidota bacterium]
MKIAVTAANGQLGASSIKELINVIGKEQVVGIVRTPKKAAHLGIEVRKGDYNNREEYNAALQGIDGVLLVSGMDEPQKRIQQHRNVIEAAKWNRVRKIVYTSIIGSTEETAFSPIVQSNRQTENDVRESGLEWAIGRNGIYIEPDLDYRDTYVREGEIRNCAGHGKCGYTSRSELGLAYSQMLLHEKHNGKTYNLSGKPISQGTLADFMNRVFGTNLKFNPISVKDYETERKAALGDFIGAVIAGIYHGIQKGFYEVPSDFEEVAGRRHTSPTEMMELYKRLF